MHALLLSTHSYLMMAVFMCVCMRCKLLCPCLFVIDGMMKGRNIKKKNITSSRISPSLSNVVQFAAEKPPLVLE